METEVDRSLMIQENRQINIQLEQLGSRVMAQKGLTASRPMCCSIFWATRSTAFP